MSEDGTGATDFWEARAGLILNLRQHGVTDPDILRAFETVQASPSPHSTARKAAAACAKRGSVLIV